MMPSTDMELIPPQARDETVTSAIRDLQRNARYDSDIAAWLKQNVSLLNLPVPSSPEAVDVHLQYDAQSLKFGGVSELDVIVSIRITFAQQRHAVLDDLLRVSDDIGNTRKTEHTFKMTCHMDDWRFLTAQLAVLRLMGFIDENIHLFAASTDALLDKYVPLHFPGFTWAGLKTMANADLLPLRQEGHFSLNFIDMLYQSSVAAKDTSLPVSLTLYPE